MGAIVCRRYNTYLVMTPYIYKKENGFHILFTYFYDKISNQNISTTLDSISSIQKLFTGYGITSNITKR